MAKKNRITSFEKSLQRKTFNLRDHGGSFYTRLNFYNTHVCQNEIHRIETDGYTIPFYEVGDNFLSSLVQFCSSLYTFLVCQNDELG